MHVNLTELFGRRRGPAVALSQKEIALLDAIVKTGGATGACAADLVKAINTLTQKVPCVRSVYGAIIELERKGLVITTDFSTPSQGGRPRRLFKLTETGRVAHTLGEAMAVAIQSRVQNLPLE